MLLFGITNDDVLNPIKEFPFKLEKEIQHLTEKNIDSIFGYEFVCSEFAINNFRIDTLAFDRSSLSFIIIEYKRDKNFSVVDQGFAYLSLMLNNKSDFILEYNEHRKQAIKKDSVDWSQSKIIFISPGFTTYQREAINFKDLPIELWEIKQYANKTIYYNKIQNTGSQESIKTISKRNENIDRVTQEIKIYTEQEHLEKASPNVRELYDQLKNAILSLGSIEIRPKKMYIAFTTTSNIVDIVVQKNALKIFLNLRQGQLDDPKKLVRDVSSTGHWGNGDYELQMNSDEGFEYIMSLIKQVFDKQ